MNSFQPCLNLIRTIVVDDHSGFRKVLKRLLSRYPFIEVVGEAQSAEESLDLIKVLSPDLVTVDVHLPGMNGFELTRILKRDFPRLQTVIISVNGNHFFRQEAEQLRCLYVTKESLMDELPPVADILNARFIRISKSS